MCDYVKRPRINKQQTLRFAEWFYLEQDTEELLKISNAIIRKYFKRDTGILVSRKFIDDNKQNKWIVINNQLYRRDQPWTHPKQIDL